MSKTKVFLTFFFVLTLTVDQARGAILPINPVSDYQGSGQRISSLEMLKPLGPITAKFREAGTYYLGQYRGGEGFYITDGPRAEDVLAPCGGVGGPKTNFYGQVCIEPGGRVVRAQAPAGAGASGSVPVAGGSGEVEVVYTPVDFEALAGKAVLNTSPGGMVLRVQPDQGWVYTDVPTIAYLTGQGRTVYAVVDGVGASVSWQVQGHRVDFDDPVVSSVVESVSNGAPYPDESITWTYKSAGRAAPSAVTTWRAVVDIGGSSYAFDSARTTTSSVSEFEVRKPKFSLTVPGYKGK